MTQGSLPFPDDDGPFRKQRGMELALDAVVPWPTLARAAVRQLVERGGPFTSEDVTALVGLPRDVGTNRNNAVGAVMSGCAKRGLIRRIGYQPALRPESHARIVAVWTGHRWPGVTQ